MNIAHWRLETQRLVLAPFTHAYLQDYYEAFTPEVARYQYPDPFESLEDAKRLLSNFLEQMEQGNMLELVILRKDGTFLGSMEAFGLKEKRPELGLWLKASAQGMGYGYEAIRELVTYLQETGGYEGYLYEADERNLPSIRLVQKFPHEERGCEEVVTESGKTLFLRQYWMKPPGPHPTIF